MTKDFLCLLLTDIINKWQIGHVVYDNNNNNNNDPHDR